LAPCPRDAPFVDKNDVEADEVYDSVIDVDVDLVLTKFSYVDEVGIPTGCTSRRAGKGPA
jgi:hypothetical protein